MIVIDISRYTIIRLEKALDKYNKLHKYSLNEYQDIIDKLLEFYLEERKEV